MTFVYTFLTIRHDTLSSVVFRHRVSSSCQQLQLVEFDLIDYLLDMFVCMFIASFSHH